MSTRRKPPPVPAYLVTCGEAARRLSIGVRTLYRLIQKRRFPQPLRFSRKLVRFRVSDLEAHLAELSRRRAAGEAAHG